jgi:hypothetical protein
MTENTNGEGSVLAYSDSAFNRGVVVGTDAPVNTTMPSPRSNQVWITGPEAAPSRSQAPAPSIAHVEAVTQGNLSGPDLAQSHGAGIMATVRDRTGDLIVNRAPTANDLVTITLNSGRQMTVPIRLAVSEGFLAQDAAGKFVDADRAGQQRVVVEMQKLEAAKREAEALQYGDEGVEKGIASLSASMAESGVDFGTELAAFLGSAGDDYARTDNALSEPAQRWAAEKSVDLPHQMRNLMDHLKLAVVTEVLQPQGIDASAFLEYLSSPMNRAAGTRAALFAFHGRSLDGFKALARSFLDTGGRARQKR